MLAMELAKEDHLNLSDRISLGIDAGLQELAREEACCLLQRLLQPSRSESFVPQGESMDVLLGVRPMPDRDQLEQDLIADRQMFQARLRETLLGSGDYQVVDGDEAHDLVVDGRLLVVEDHGALLLPRFQIQFTPEMLEDFADVNRSLSPTRDPWTMWFWWVASSPQLDGLSPYEALQGGARDMVSQLAKQGLES